MDENTLSSSKNPLNLEDSKRPDPALNLFAPAPRVTRISRKAVGVLGIVGAVLLFVVLMVGLRSRSSVRNPAQEADTNRSQGQLEIMRKLPSDYSFDVRRDGQNVTYEWGGINVTVPATQPATQPAKQAKPEGLSAEELARLAELRRNAEERRRFLEQQRKEMEAAMNSRLIFQGAKAIPIAKSNEQSVSASTPRDANEVALECPRVKMYRELVSSGVAPDEARRIVETGGGTATATNASVLASLPPTAAESLYGPQGRGERGTESSIGGSYLGGYSDTISSPGISANLQREKETFLANAGKIDAYVSGKLMAPVSPYELKAGSIIPGSLITAINTDLPGQIIGQVTQNVYDTKTGKYLLIPQGTRLLGKYSSLVSNGQNRAQIVWARLILPNGKSIMIDGMPGSDQEGMSGLQDRVDYHLDKLASMVGLTTAIAWGGNLARDKTRNSDYSLDAVGDSVAQESNRVGSKIIDRQLDIQPTIKIRAGWNFNVLVNKDLILEPYEVGAY